MSKFNKKILLLNASYEPIRLIPWQQAVCLVYRHKAAAPAGYTDSYTLTTTDGFFELPSAIVLKKYVNIPYYNVRCTRRNIFRRDELMCQYTGKRLQFKDASIDHIIPTSRGGQNTWDNMVTCEKRLNQRKGSRTPEEAGLTLIRPAKKPQRANLVIGAYPEMETWKQFCK